MFESINKNQFIALLLIQAAEVDYNFAPQEKEYILSFVSETEFIKLLMINSSDRIACHDFLKTNLKSFFQSHKEQREIKEILLQLFLVDKSYNQFEQTYMKLFREEFLDYESANPA